MKKTLTLLVLVIALSAAAVHAAEWTGYISDAKCGVKGESPDHAECARSCIKSGIAAVLVTGGKMYALDKQDEAKKLAGEKVVLKGTLSSDGKSIKVESITKAGL